LLSLAKEFAPVFAATAVPKRKGKKKGKLYREFVVIRESGVGIPLHCVVGFPTNEHLEGAV